MHLCIRTLTIYSYCTVAEEEERHEDEHNRETLSVTAREAERRALSMRRRESAAIEPDNSARDIGAHCCTRLLSLFDR